MKFGGSKDGQLHIAKSLSVIENDRQRAREMIESMPEREYFVVGITGSPGAGKSSLTDCLADINANERDTAIIAIDPTSPFTGGAFLGDRLRLKRSVDKAGVFVRSMASRGNVGGLNASIYDAVEFLGRSGFDTIYVETVGAGQSETDIKNLADLVILVLAPGLGDDVQCMKAGIMEIGDIFVVNKMDLQGADQLAARTKAVLEMNGKSMPVLLTNSIKGTGIGELHKSIENFLEKLKKSGKAEEKKAQRRLHNNLNSVYQIIKERFAENDKLEELIKHLLEMNGRFTN